MISLVLILIRSLTLTLMSYRSKTTVLISTLFFASFCFSCLLKILLAAPLRLWWPRPRWVASGAPISNELDRGEGEKTRWFQLGGWKTDVFLQQNVWKGSYMLMTKTTCWKYVVEHLVSPVDVFPKAWFGRALEPLWWVDLCTRVVSQRARKWYPLWTLSVMAGISELNIFDQHTSATLIDWNNRTGVSTSYPELFFFLFVLMTYRTKQHKLTSKTSRTNSNLLFWYIWVTTKYCNRLE